MPELSGEAEAVILVKASPQVGIKHGETVCCAGLTPNGEWLRLYPVTFRSLEDAKQFGRWDRVRFKWRRPKDDARPESLRVDQESIEIVGKLQPAERASFLNPLEVTGLRAQAESGHSLALLRPREPRFFIEQKTDAEVEEERRDFMSILAQQDLFNSRELVPLAPCPYRFKYRYKTDDGDREGTCQDWETDATYFHWERKYGVEGALQAMKKRFGDEYAQKGVVFAMGTHSRYPDVWLINGVVRLDAAAQMALL